MDENVFYVDGFAFSDEESYKKAKAEHKAVEYLKSQVDYSSPEAVLAVYKQIIEQDVFHTPVGNGFLAEMHRHLIENDAIDNNRIPDMPNGMQPGRKEDIKPEEKEAPKEAPKEEPKEESKKESLQEPKKPEKRAVEKRSEHYDGKYRRRFYYSLFLNAVLIIMVIAMFALTLTSDNPNILNYKQKIEDEYATWEQNLTNREKALNEWESDLNDRQQEDDE